MKTKKVKVLSKEEYDRLKDSEGNISSIQFTFAKEMSRFCGLVFEIQDREYYIDEIVPIINYKVLNKHDVKDDPNFFNWSIGMFEAFKKEPKKVNVI